MEVLKVSTKSNPNSVAGALAAIIKEKNIVEIQAVGAGAINQAVKAIAIARGFVAPSGKDIVCIPAFTDIEIDGEERTAIKLIVQPMVMTGGGPAFSTYSLVYYIYDTGTVNWDMGYASAMAIIFAILVITLAGIQNYVTNRKED